MCVIEIPLTQSILLKSIDSQSLSAVLSAFEIKQKHLASWLPWYDSAESSSNDNLIIKSILLAPADSSINLGIWEKGTFAGVVSLLEIEAHHRTAQMNYWMLDEQHENLAIKACKALIEYGLKELGLLRIEMLIVSDNTKGTFFVQELGFIFEGTFRSYFKIDNAYKDVLIYSIIS